MAIQADWLARKDGWQERYNQLIDHINEYDDPGKIRPKLTPRELEWYQKSVARLKAENESIAKECKAAGTEPWRTHYGYI